MVKFSKGVNVITGQSDSGKTAIIRAIRWVCENKPSGDAFMSTWGGDTYVKIVFTNCVVIRQKGKENFYLLNKKGLEEPLIFKAFGTKVPQEILDAINLDEVNLQFQMDSPYLIADTPGEVSKHFNRIGSIEQIDSSLSKVQGWIRSLGNDLNASEAEIERHTTTLQEFEYLDKLEVELEALEQLGNSFSVHRAGTNKLEQFVEQFSDISIELSKILPKLEAGKDLNKILDMYTQVDSLREQYKGLKRICKAIKALEEEIDDISELDEVENEVNAILTMYDKAAEIEAERKTLWRITTSIDENTKAIAKQETKLKQLQKKWAQEAPEVCPLCGQKMEHTHES